MFTTVATAEFFHDNIAGPEKNCTQSSELNTTVVMFYDDIKGKVFMNLVYTTECPKIFRNTQNRSEWSFLIKSALANVIGVTGHTDIETFMNRRVYLGQTTMFSLTYLDYANCRLHDCVLRKFANVIFA